MANRKEGHVSDEEFTRRSLAAGYSARDTANTLALTKRIERVLEDQDLDPFQAPELQMTKTIRLVRLFIELQGEESRNADKGLVAWLGTFDDRAGSADFARWIANGDHWTWMRANMPGEVKP